MADDPGDTQTPARKGFPTLTERLRRLLTVPGNRINILWRQAAARHYHPHSNVATIPDYNPHYMGIAEGEQIWANTENRHAQWLSPAREAELLEHLEQHLGILGGK